MGDLMRAMPVRETEAGEIGDGDPGIEAGFSCCDFLPLVLCVILFRGFPAGGLSIMLLGKRKFVTFVLEERLVTSNADYSSN
jgi:hypothetical protein